MDYSQEQRTRLLRIGAVVLATLLAFALFNLFNSPGREDQLHNEPLEEGQTEIRQSEALRSHINTTQVGFLAADLNFFGERTIQTYRTSQGGNVFTLKSGVEKLDDGTLEFVGVFDKAKDELKVQLSPQKNDRLKVSITNTSNDANIDSELPSNSKQNQFIATLPINDNPTYAITYVAPGTVSISAFRRDPAIIETARARLESLLGKETADKLDVTISYPTPNFNE
jgi:hypothetical protein